MTKIINLRLKIVFISRIFQEKQSVPYGEEEKTENYF
jgi:hypothetical protein